MKEWNILDLYFKNHKYPFTSHHLDSYRDFIKNNIPNIIKSYNPITMIKYNDSGEIIIKVEVYVGNKNSDEIFIDRPITFDNSSPKIITPNDARLRNLTYETHIYANVLVKIVDNDTYNYETVFKNVAIGSIPIMLHSDACILNGQGQEILKSLDECVYDMGGYFIIDGKEKVIIAQERITSNKLFTSKLTDDDNFSYKGLIKCTSDVGESALAPKSLEFYLVKNTINTEEKEVNDNYISKKGAILCSFKAINGNKIPVFILFRALGVETDKDICDMIFGDDLNETEKIYFYNFIRPSISSASNVYTQEEAFNYMKPISMYKTIDHIKSALVTELFPNITKFENKGKYLAYLIKEFINTCININDVSDRDGYTHKRVDISGYLLSQLFYESYTKLSKFIRDNLDKTYNYGAWKSYNNYDYFINDNNIYKIIPSLIITKSFSRSLKGMWGLEDDDDPELGMVQDLSRISYIGFLSHLRNVNIPLDRDIKLTSPHRLHSQQYGIMCPFATPDGASVGYLKNMALLAKITPNSNIDFVKECLNDISSIILIENYNKSLNRNITKIFLNNSLYAITFEPNMLVRTLKAYRRNNLINPLISISWNIKNNIINILTDSGRSCRPLIIANKYTKIDKYTNWFDLLTGSINTLAETDKNDNFYYNSFYTSPKTLSQFANKSDSEILDILEKNGAVIEYIDIDEQDTIYIAMDKTTLNSFHTHVEIHPSTMLSAISANIPLSNHNQSARNVFHAAQSKQAIGVYSTSFNKRFDTMSYVLHYSQKPLITTRISDYTLSNNLPNGFNVIVAIMSYSGFNQEDSIMINKNSLDRGLFSLSYYKSITATAKIESQYEKTIFANPLIYQQNGYKINNLKSANYNYINEEGFISEGVYIPKGQKVVVVGMLSEKYVYKQVKKGVFTELVKETIYTDCSITTDNSLFGKIDKVYIDNKINDEDTKICKVRFLKIKRPEFGDKHASRHGQKGVIGMILPEENLPFTKNGIKPDIIINPHAIPSRMTIGHLVECVFAKLSCLNGTFGDGTVFLPFQEKLIYNSLEDLGFDKHGDEILYNGFTGKQLETEIFIGPTFYFRLKHMVAEKMHARDIGPKVSLTRQPTAGRRKGGGLRIGEMERDSVLSHGITKFMKESMTIRSDNYTWPVCQNCGSLAIYNPNKKNFILECRNCNTNKNIVQVNTPYCFKLLVQELETMGLQLRLNTDKLNYIDNETYIDFDMITFEDSIDNDIMSGGNLSNESNDIVNITELKRLNNIRESLEESIVGGEGGSEDDSEGDYGSIAESEGESIGGSEVESEAGSETGSEAGSEYGSEGSEGGSIGGSIGGSEGGSEYGSVNSSIKKGGNDKSDNINNTYYTSSDSENDYFDGNFDDLKGGTTKNLEEVKVIELNN
jgi:DNA-directed RNA polymerase II subunit RPB2